MAHTFEINPGDPKSIEAALRTEWLLSNGLGGYAMGTLLGVNTRRYHGLFIASTKPPVGRVVVLHSMIERLIVGGREFDLSTQQFGSDAMLHPDGWRWPVQVTHEPPLRITWRYRLAGVELMRRLTLEPGEQRARLEYEIEGAAVSTKLLGRPFLPLRDFHSLDREASSASPRVDHADRGWLSLERAGVMARMSDGALRDDPQWWRDFAYTLDRDRGQDWREDLWSPGEFEAQPAANLRITAAVEIDLPDAPQPGAMLLEQINEQESKAVDRTLKAARDPALDALRVAAKSFVVGRFAGGESRDGSDWTVSMLAGFPWFGDWGRDTMIALPGLLLARQRMLGAERALQCFAKHLRNGLIPNLFDDYGGAAHHNTVDASLWFVHAVHALGQSADGMKSVDRSLVDACREIVRAYREGTDFNIHMESDGLIAAGDASTQLTWMDAARDGVVFTPRLGKAVEINALWHNTLLCLSELTGDANERNELIMLARRVAASFRSAFWWDERQCLHDCLVPDGRDATSRPRAFAPDGKLRPNQIFAVSLPFSPLSDVQRRAVVKIVGERLLTPYGLRTLDCDDPSYKPRYEGSLFERDAAYHNGTVWPWLLGPFAEALLRIENFSDASKQRVRDLFAPLIGEMNSTAGGRCLGQIAEVYDGEPPHRPSGCPAQAWSVAEALRVLTMVSR